MLENTISGTNYHLQGAIYRYWEVDAFDGETTIRWRVDAVIRYKALKEYHSYPRKIGILSVEEYQSFEYLESTGIISKGE